MWIVECGIIPQSEIRNPQSRRGSLKATKAQCEELDRRISAREKTPDKVSAWDEVKSRLKSRE